MQLVEWINSETDNRAGPGRVIQRCNFFLGAFSRSHSLPSSHNFQSFFLKTLCLF